MEYVDGVNLRQLLQTRKIAPEEALAIVPKICEALQFAHEQGIVHRDIKPENMLLDKQGRVKIADFGIAKMLGAAGPRRALTAGTAGHRHAALHGAGAGGEAAEVDHRADIYSLGVVFYEMLTGELPLGKFAAAVAQGADGRAAGRSGAARAGEGAGAPLPAGQRGEDGRGDDPWQRAGIAAGGQINAGSALRDSSRHAVHLPRRDQGDQPFRAGISRIPFSARRDSRPSADGGATVPGHVRLLWFLRIGRRGFLP